MTRKSFIVGFVLAGLIGCGESSGWSSGDRVLVAKCLYDTHAAQPHRYDVVVFKYPETPIEKNTPKNYIKRLIGLPGEIIAIFFGRLYRWAPEPGQEIPYRKEDEGIDPRVLWQKQHQHNTDKFARDLFNEGHGPGKFQILRKPPDVMMALRRIVFDNDFQPTDLAGMVKPRWDANVTRGWKTDGGKVFVHKGDTDATDWLRYQHLVVERSRDKPATGAHEIKPRLITDRMGYNSYALVNRDETPAPDWAGDLMLECDVEVQKAQGELTMELSRGVDRFQARWDLADGVCTLVRLAGGKEEVLDSKPTRLRGTGTYVVRFANMDARLTVWVDRELPFDTGVTYHPPEVRAPGENITDYALLERRGPKENDLQPASLGSKGGALTVKRLRLRRDTYYTLDPRGPDYVDNPGNHGQRPEVVMPPENWANGFGKDFDPQRWEPIQKQTFRTLYVQPGHYLCLGDNSTASSDSRDWGLVPERLLLGRALGVYFPIHRLGPIR